jgi:hypothetical protein
LFYRKRERKTERKGFCSFAAALSCTYDEVRATLLPSDDFFPMKMEKVAKDRSSIFIGVTFDTLSFFTLSIGLSVCLSVSFSLFTAATCNSVNSGLDGRNIFPRVMG